MKLHPITFLLKILTPLFFVLVLAGCGKSSGGDSYPFYVGTYTKGESEGIYRYILGKDGELRKVALAAVSENPSFLALSSDRKYLLAVNENAEGTVESFQVKGDSLLLVNSSSSGGAHPCFVSTNNQGYILTANYTGGNVGLLKMGERGKLSGLLDVQQHSGKGSTDRQTAPHAHSARFAPKDKGVISVDLGTNELWFSKISDSDKKLMPTEPRKLGMAPGAGPRHLAFHPKNNWLYVVNELDCTVTQLVETESGKYEKAKSVSTLPEGFDGQNTCADIHATADGKFVYVSNRGDESIAIFGVDAENGALSLVGHEKVRGKSPRNFALSPDENFLIVANQLTNNIISFKRDKETGLLTYVSEIGAPTPVCILF
ncbi:6-phosphogluconolactonase (plasmid) [Fulvitalea axinellae]|uniref:6-phosphogluconolactonase n=1 Tax=Fulvitalea axinellae TaxID=1182444 RepID=A0AAU9DHH0_9BACT|nr:6-phosphogluconolactonase [Fulvitalea axinellae]